MISLHKNFADYSQFFAELRADWGDEMKEWDSMLIDLNGRVLKPLSLKYLAEDQPKRMRIAKPKTYRIG